MRLTERKLRRIVKEELKNVVSENIDKDVIFISDGLVAGRSHYTLNFKVEKIEDPQVVGVIHDSIVRGSNVKLYIPKTSNISWVQNLADDVNHLEGSEKYTVQVRPVFDLNAMFMTVEPFLVDQRVVNKPRRLMTIADSSGGLNDSYLKYTRDSYEDRFEILVRRYGDGPYIVESDDPERVANFLNQYSTQILVLGVYRNYVYVAASLKDRSYIEKILREKGVSFDSIR